MKKITIAAGLLSVVVVLSVAAPVQAGFLDNLQKRFYREVNKEERKENRQEQKEDFKEDLREKSASRPAFIRALKKIRIAFGNGKITGIDGTTITVDKEGKSYTVLTGTFDKCTTKFKRRFWGDSSLSEYSVGDMVNVTGRFQDEAKTIIEACVIRDVSIQKRFGVFVGEVLSLTGSGWVMKPVGSRDNQTVTVTGSTKFVNRKEQTITKADVLVGHRVRVKGLWNKTSNTVTDVVHVKDYSLPVRLTVTPTPTVVVTTPTPTLTPATTPTETPIPTETPTPTPTP